MDAAKRAARTPPLPAPIVNRSKSYCPEPFVLAPLLELSALTCDSHWNKGQIRQHNCMLLLYAMLCAGHMWKSVK